MTKVKKEAEIKEQKKKPVKEKTIAKKNEEKRKEHKEGFLKKISNWFKSVIRELKNVKWPSRKEMVKNSVATIVFIIFFAVFFLLIEIGVSYLLEYFG